MIALRVFFVLSSINIGLFFSAAVSADPTVVASLNFEDGVIPNTSRCSFGSQQGGALAISTDPSQNFNKSKGSIKGSYPLATGGMYVWGGCDVKDLNTEEVYIEFYAKLPQPVKQGLKFVKIFGQKSASGTANTTFQLDYTGVASGKGSLYQISFGDGSSEVNDAQNVVNLDGTYPSWVGRSKDVASVKTAKKPFPAFAWGDAWHHFRIHAKFNSGTSKDTEKADGEYSLEIDGTLYAEASKLFNRHYNNLPIQRIAFFDWAQGGTAPFEIWYDDITITTGGFLSKPNPKGVKLQ